MKELLEYIVKNLVKNSDEVNIDFTNDTNSYNFVVYVNASDLGAVIGKDGNTAQAIRTLVRSMAKPHDKVNIKFSALS